MLTIYPLENYDSLISITDANEYAINYSLHNDNWSALSDSQKEVYLRIATNRIVDVIDITLLTEVTHCMKRSCTLMAIRDLVFGISSGVNENVGAITREKVGDIEVEYQQSKNAKGKNKNPYPAEVVTCLNTYGANLSNTGLSFAKLVRS